MHIIFVFLHSLEILPKNHFEQLSFFKNTEKNLNINSKHRT